MYISKQWPWKERVWAEPRGKSCRDIWTTTCGASSSRAFVPVRQLDHAKDHTPRCRRFSLDICRSSLQRWRFLFSSSFIVCWIGCLTIQLFSYYGKGWLTIENRKKHFRETKHDSDGISGYLVVRVMRGWSPNISCNILPRLYTSYYLNWRDLSQVRPRLFTKIYAGQDRSQR